MRPWLVPPRRTVETRAPGARTTEASPEVLAATGAIGSGYDPVDKEYGWTPAGSAGRREVPWWTRERAIQNSIAADRSNPMARAILDTYISFCVGDSGVSYLCSNPEVEAIVREFWHDPRNNLTANQAVPLRSALITGERAIELMTGATTGVVRYAPIATPMITEVRCLNGNACWPSELVYRDANGDERGYDVAMVSDESKLREGEALWWAPFRNLETDTRSLPLLTAVLDSLEAHDLIKSNLVDRTALARYLVWDVTVQGDQDDVDAYIATLPGGLYAPPSGTVNVHNHDAVWEPKNAQSGAFEDTAAAMTVLTDVAAGVGLAKHWLGEPGDANRATSMTMAEPVRRRIQGVQRMWLDHQTEFVRYAVDRAVAAGRLPRTVDARDSRTGETQQIPAAETVTVIGPEIAAADAQYQASVLLNLSTGLQQFVEIGVMSRAGAQAAARRAWENYMGITYSPDLDDPARQPDELASHIEDDEIARRKQARTERLKRATPVQPASGGGKA